MKFYFILQIISGEKIANTKEINNKLVEIISEKKSVEITTPTKIDFEKSVLGKNNKPIIKPNKIDEYAFFSLNFLL